MCYTPHNLHFAILKAMSRAGMTLKGIAVLIVFGISARSANSTGTITGLVVDPLGAVIENASIRVFNGNSNVPTYTGVSAADGSFKISSVAAGSVTLKVKAPGFREKSISVRIQPDGKTHLSAVTLQLAGCDDPGVICCLEITAETKPLPTP